MQREELTKADDIEDMLTIKEVKDILGISYGVILGHIRNGKLQAHKVTGQPIAKRDVGETTFGIRVKPRDLREYLATTLIN